MSTMAGPRHPQSPWTRESNGGQLTTTFSPPTLPMRDPSSPSAKTSTISVDPNREQSSPNYFGINIGNTSNPVDSNPGPYAQKNWDGFVPTQSFVASPGPQLFLQKPEARALANPLKRSLTNRACERPMDLTEETGTVSEGQQAMPLHVPETLKYSTSPYHFDKVDRHSGPDEQLAIAQETGTQHNAVFPPVVDGQSSMRVRAAEANTRLSTVSPRNMGEIFVSLNSIHEDMRAISIERLSEIIKSPGDETLILDIRPYGHFSEAHIQNALNLCIPTTLLKRPSFDTRKLQATFSAEAEKARFKMWRSCSSIVVYDTTTSDKRDAGQLLNVLKKFTAEGWKGEGCYLKGGFAAFANRFPELIQQHSHQGSTHKKQPSMDIQLPSTLPIAGGCALPKTSTVVNPFFGNIRQNMDLVGGVGQIAVKLPKGLTESNKKSLPAWLRAASDAKDQGLGVSKKFLALETKELDRMRQALSVDNVCVNTPSSEPQGKYRVAGIEKGTKNRYNDIYPFDHSRVRLQDVPTGDCDYVNASHIHTKYSNKRYIATQAPVPDTFNDFWRVVWEQDVRVIVSLTAEVERGHVKCHPYWKSGNYGPLKLKCFAERQIEVESADHSPIGLRCVPNPVRCDPSLDPFAAGNSPHDRSREASDDPVIIVRHFSLSHSSFPFQPLREITQLQYPSWPDFGTTSQPSHLLKLIDQCNNVVRATSAVKFNKSEAEPKGQQPVLVHCSAGCGRTGTFCTVDSVLDMLKRQRAVRGGHSRGLTVGQSYDEAWAHDDQMDLVAKAVEDFRTQRPSMVQNLGQFVLCYESVLEWFVSQLEGRDSPAAAHTL